jgi:hypothetical protein
MCSLGAENFNLDRYTKLGERNEEARCRPNAVGSAARRNSSLSRTSSSA